MIDNCKHKKHSSIIYIVFMVGGLLWISSCASFKGAPVIREPANATEPSLKGAVFQSKDYALYRLEEGETPALLAKAFFGDQDRAWVIEDENRNTTFEKGRFVVIPLKDRKKGGLHKDGYQVVPILCYHRLARTCQPPLCISANAFEKQMKYLRDHGYRTITMAELYGFLQYRHGIPARSVVITFDDGYQSFSEIALPILRQYGYKATLFVYTDFIGHSNEALTWNQLKEIKTKGFEIGSHSVSHTDFTEKRADEDDHAYAARIKRDLSLSKKILDERLDQDTTYLSFPSGGHNPRILQWAEQAGYKIGLSAKKGSNPFFADPMALKRNQIIAQDIRTFITHLVVFKKSSLKEDYVQ